MSCPAPLNPLLFTVASRIASLRPYGITISSFCRSGKVLSSLRLFSLDKPLPVVLLESDCLHCLVRPPHEDPPNPTHSQEKVHVEVIPGFTVRSLSFCLSVRRLNLSLTSVRLATAWSSHEQDVRIHLTVESRLPAPNLSASTSSSREIVRNILDDT